jgi:maltose O-acetyltransferase
MEQTALRATGVTHEALPWRVWLVGLIFRNLPPFVGARLLCRGLRWAGVRIDSNVNFWGFPRFTGGPVSNLSVGEASGFNVDVEFHLAGPITFGDNVSTGPEAKFIAALDAPIRIGSGSWIGARAVIMPGVTIGRGSVIGAGTVVSSDVPDNLLLAGPRRASLARWRTDVSTPK